MVKDIHDRMEEDDKLLQKAVKLSRLGSANARNDLKSDILKRF